MQTFNGKLHKMPDEGSLIRYAAASPADHNGSFSGSGFPFASEEQAFDTTPNQGSLHVEADGMYTVQLRKPNSYYRRLGSDLIAPSLYISYLHRGEQIVVTVVLGPSIPFRTLTYPAERHDVLFYDRESHDILRPDRDAKTQECMLRESGYTDVRQPVDFWGQVPPQ